MKRKSFWGIVTLLIPFLLFTSTFLLVRQGDGCEKKPPQEKLKAFFLEADQFAAKEETLNPEQVKKIEESLGAKLGEEDKNPVFHIAKKEEKPLGFVFFTDGEGSEGVIHSGVALDLKGKIVKVQLYDLNIPDSSFLDQFIGKGIEDNFQVGKDIQPLPGDEETSRSISLLPKKTLLISYTLLLKRASDEKSREGEPETLSELMHLIQEQYFILRDYFREQEAEGSAKEDSVKIAPTEKDVVSASHKLVEYIGKIPNFEPSKNKKKRKEFLLIQDQVNEAAKDLAKRIQEGEAKDAKRAFEDIVMFVEMAHKRFSKEPIDIDYVHEEGDEGEEHHHEEGHEHH